ncbi:retrovirus-related pol polyprotein from transposon TNT 1-94 [Tanacetum coccineum]
MQAVLTHHRYKKALRGITHKPQSMSDEDWLELDEKALATIQLFLTREVLREVIHETIAAGLWLKLESLYMTKSLANKLRLKDRLYTFRMKPGTSVQDHLDEFNTILIDLENLDVDIDDEDKAVLLVISFPTSYKHIKEIMLYGNRETLSFDDVKSALLSKQKYDDDVEPKSGEGLLKNKLEREGKGNNEKKPEKAVEVAIAKGDSDGDVYLAIDTEKFRVELIVDSGCTFHMIPRRSWFTIYESFNGGNVYMGNHSICPVIGKGNIQVKMHDGVVRTITGVRHVPDLKRNLISLSTLEANGCKYSGEGGVMKIFKGVLVLMKAIQSGGLYVLQGTVVYGNAGVATSKASLDDSKLWHYFLGHIGEKGMKYLAKKGLIKVLCNLEFSEHYVFGKQKKVSFSPGIHRTRDALDYIHSDLWGSSFVTSRGDEVFPTFKEWKVLIENKTGKKIKKLRTENGLEFCGESFSALCQKYGFTRHHTLVRTSQQNGVAERMNRTIIEKVRCMLSHANLDKDFWVEAATTATYLINRSPHRSLDGNIPEILWSGNSVDYSNLRVFGCPVYVHVNEGKLVPRAVKCIFLGYGSGVKGYRVWCPDPKYRKIIHSRDVTFNEDVIINSGKDFVPPHNVDNNHTEGKVEFEFDVENSTHTQPPFNDEHIETQDDGNMPTSPQSQSQTEYLLARDHERRQVNRPPRLEDYQCDLVAYAYAAAAIEKCEPTNYLEAISSPECGKWVVAMKEEVKDGILEVESKRYKARYVVRGFDQREGIDFNDVFSPVVRHTSIRVLLSIVVLQDLELEQLDVKTAFLHGHLEEEIYVEQPEGFKVPGKEDHVCRLKKSLYGLKQSPRQWYKRFDSFMIGHGYDRCSYDECVYLRKFPDGSFLYLVLYVDDMLIAAPNKDQIRELKDQLSNEFDMKDLGAAKRILGMEIRRDRKMGKLTLSQTDYISKVLKKFNMSSCKPVPTPLAPHFKLSSHECPKSEEDKEDMSRVPYSSAVGSLMYAMVCTRPDLAHAVSVVSRYMHNPGKIHWEAVKCILRYLKGTSNIGLSFEKSRASPNGVVGYVDSVVTFVG